MSSDTECIERERGPVRKAVKNLEFLVRQFCGQEPTWSDDIDVKLSTCSAKVERLQARLQGLDAQMLASISSNASEEVLDNEVTECEKYLESLDNGRCMLIRYRERNAPATATQASGPGGSGDLAAAIKSLIELQRQNLTERREAGDRSGMEYASAISESDGGVAPILNRLVSLQEASATGAVQLPCAKIRHFSGANDDFLVFCDSFRRLVHERKNLTDLQRNQILRDVLEGEAARTVANIPVTADGYGEAVRHLMRRYGCIETLAYGVFTSMLELPKMPKSADPEPLRELLDRVHSHTLTLDMLKLNHQYYSCMMYPILLRALPEQLSAKFLSTIAPAEDTDAQTPVSWEVTVSTELPSAFANRFRELRDFLTKELSIREKTRKLCPRSHTQDQVKSSAKRQSQASSNVYLASQGNVSGGGDSKLSNSWKRGRQGTNGSRQQQQRYTGASSECFFCKGGHMTGACRTKLEIGEKRRKVHQAGLCRKCLGQGHYANDCTKEIVCRICKGPHLPVMCDKPSDVTVHTIGGTKGLLPTGHLDVRAPEGQQMCARFLLDSGSQRSFVTKRLADTLGAPIVSHEWVYLHVFGGERPAGPQRLPLVKVELIPVQGEPLQMRMLVVPEITSDVLPAPSAHMRTKLRGAVLAERSGGPSRLDLLLSAPDTFRVTEGAPCRVEGDTFTIETRFGHVVVSEPSTGPKGVLVSAVSAPKLEQFWSLESLGISPEELENPVDSTEVVRTFKETIERCADGHYQVRLNLRPNVTALEPNVAMASKQLKALGKRLSKDVSLKADYIREMKAFIDGGFAEPLPEGEEAKFVMPHFPVIQPDKESYKVRPVFNASASPRGKLSLNDCIADTPNLLPCPLRALSNFRLHEVAWTGDISKAYLMVRVHPEHRNFLSFLWFADEEHLMGEVMYRMTATSFGVKDSQFNTITVIREHAAKFEETYPEASRRLQEDLYMDDLLTGAKSPVEAVRIWEDSRAILAQAGMSMKKFKTNCSELRERFGDSGSGRDVLLCPPKTAKVLGVAWDQEADVFTFVPDAMIAFVEAAPPTMRTLMGACARLYDPQGLLAPFSMQLKLVLQEAHLAKVRLDDALPAHLVKRWWSWCQDLANISEFRVPRWFRLTDAAVELHGFCDASDRAYAAVIYLKCVGKDGKVHVSLVASKAKLAPLKQLEALTIPKKELMAAMLVTRLMRKCREHLKLDCPIYYWSDAQVALHWVHSNDPDRWGVFVKNRLSEILKLTVPHQWSHCPGKQNPADLPSRGVGMSKLLNNPLWLGGPEFLREEASKYPVFKRDSEVDRTLPEARVMTVSAGAPVIDPAQFSSAERAVRVYAYVRRVVTWKKNQSPVRGPLTAKEIVEAKQRLLVEAQDRCLGEAKASLLRGGQPEEAAVACFKPFIGSDGLIRVGGRLQDADEPYDARHPILLRDDPWTRLLILEAHQGRVQHMKTEAVMNELREKFWIMRMRRLVKSVIHDCAACLRDRARVPRSLEAPLPPSRVEMSFRPFKTTGIDYMGPFMIKTGASEKKVWVALFTCAVVRAIHLEVVEDLTAAACLSALKRFAAHHGVPSRIVSDNALTFKKANSCLSALWKSLKGESLQNYLGQSGVEWVFNVPRAPWWGGFFERLIGLTKVCLRKAIRGQKTSLLNLITTLHEIAAIVNQRPITRVPAAPDEARALTPAHFMSPNVSLTFPAGQLVSLGDKPEGLLRVWKQRERVLSTFWKRWRSEYMLMLRTAVRRKGEKGVELEPGDIVILQRGDAPRAFWQLGRIEEVLPSRDRIPRAYKVHLGGGRYVERAGKLLAKLI